MLDMIIEPPQVSVNDQILTSITNPQAPLTIETAYFSFERPLKVETLTTYTTQFIDRYAKTDFSLAMYYSFLAYLIFIVFQ